MTVSLDIFKDKQLAVMGLGRSGLSSVRALVAAGARVRAWDDNETRRAEAQNLGAVIDEIADAKSLQCINALVLSPGIPHTHPAPHPVAKAAKKAGIPILGDIELLSRADREACYIGITGTNGKSTTTALIGHIFNASGRPVSIGGNLGCPALDLPAQGQGGTYILEMSSYQLELVQQTRFNIALLLNITNDHLDRHGGVEGYIAAKMRIFRNQLGSDRAIIAVDDARTARIAETLTCHAARVVPVSANHPVAGGVYIKNGEMIDDLDGNETCILNLSHMTTLPGRHNAQNIVAAYCAARLSGIKPARIADAIRHFPGLPHRQQRVATIDKITYINDSKATNAKATAQALACYKKIYWIAGGVEKEGGYDDLAPYLDHIMHGFFIGKSAESMAQKFQDKISVTVCHALPKAVHQATGLARAAKQPEALVLLSPACASFDQYRDFEARGEEFIRQVLAIKGSSRKSFIKETG